MCLIAVLPYFEVIREVKSIEQIDTEEQRELRLYKDKVTSKHHTFLLHEVLDMTFRKFGDAGLLYVYTSSGIYTFKMKESPGEFLEAYRKLAGK